MLKAYLNDAAEYCRTRHLDGYARSIRDAITEITSLRARVAELESDGERLDKLADLDASFSVPTNTLYKWPIVTLPTEENGRAMLRQGIDTILDAALQPAPESGKLGRDGVIEAEPLEDTNDGEV